jgi:mannose-1-phosphate guanylyltransferase
MIKGIILLGGPSNRVNFGSDLPAPLIPIAGLEMVAHQIYALSRIPNLKEVLLYGYYDEGAIKNLIAEKSH